MEDELDEDELGAAVVHEKRRPLRAGSYQLPLAGWRARPKTAACAAWASEANRAAIKRLLEAGLETEFRAYVRLDERGRRAYHYARIDLRFRELYGRRVLVAIDPSSRQIFAGREVPQ